MEQAKKSSKAPEKKEEDTEKKEEGKGEEEKKGSSSSSPAATEEAYLKQKLRFVDGKILDENNDAVMMVSICVMSSDMNGD